MAAVIRMLIELYDIAAELGDPRVESYLFLSNPFPPLVIIAIYLWFVLKMGPAMMKNRKPLNIDKIIMVYNAVQVILCIDLLYRGVRYTYPFHYNILCQPMDFSNSFEAIEITKIFHMYYLIKIVDLLDTVFFVLRKKDKQITFLHVYHHAGMVILTYFGSKYLPGGHSTLTGLLNCIVHIVMYSYYLLASFNSKYKESVWWKKYVTQLQLIQFLLITVHWIIIYFQPNCLYPRWPAAFLIPQNFFMLALFGDFYRKSYMMKKSKAIN